MNQKLVNFKVWCIVHKFELGLVICTFILFSLLFTSEYNNSPRIYEIIPHYISQNIPKAIADRKPQQTKWKTDENIQQFDYFRIFQTQDIPQDDPSILAYLQYFHLTPPPIMKKLIPFTRDHIPELGKTITRIFNHKLNGFFIEAGANDGLFHSNTLELERKYKWTGLLIEPNPFMLVKLRVLGRNAWIADVCLALNGYPEKVRFMHPLFKESWGQGLGIIEHNADNPPPPQTDRRPKDYVYAGNVECFPLFSLLSAINVTVVDYLSLDVEGIEFRVLKAIPFDKLVIKVISLEWILIPEGLSALQEFFTSKNYKGIIKQDNEIIMAHMDYIHELNLKHNV